MGPYLPAHLPKSPKRQRHLWWRLALLFFSIGAVVKVYHSWTKLQNRDDLLHDLTIRSPHIPRPIKVGDPLWSLANATNLGDGSPSNMDEEGDDLPILEQPILDVTDKYGEGDFEPEEVSIPGRKESEGLFSEPSTPSAGQDVVVRFSTSGGTLSQSLAALATIWDDIARNGTVVLTVANPAFYPFLKNWECYVRPIQQRKFLVLTNDYEFGRKLSEEDGLNVVVQEISSNESDGTDANPSKLLRAVQYGTVEYQRLILARTELVAGILRLGKSVLIADNDAVWLSDPFPYLERHSEAHIIASDDGNKKKPRVLCGGFLFLRNCARTVGVWNLVLERHQRLVERAEKNHKLASFAESEQKILSDIVRKEEAKNAAAEAAETASEGSEDGRREEDASVSNGSVERRDDASGSEKEKRATPEDEPLNVKLLDQLYFPSGLNFFTLNRPQKADIQPVVIHNNYIVGSEAKLERFRNFNLWALGGDLDLTASAATSSPSNGEGTLDVGMCHLKPYTPIMRSDAVAKSSSTPPKK